jgi:hypothetical protein
MPNIQKKITYTIGDKSYANFRMAYIDGDDPGTDGNLGGLNNPTVLLPNVIDITDSGDPKGPSYLYPDGANGYNLRYMIEKIDTPTLGGTSISKFTQVEVTTTGGVETWTPVNGKENVVLTSGGVPVAGNPHGFVKRQVPGTPADTRLYFGDFDLPKIYLVGGNELAAAASIDPDPQLVKELANPPIDLGSLIPRYPPAPRPAYAPHIQALSIVHGTVDGDTTGAADYLLVLIARSLTVGKTYGPSLLARVKLDPATGGAAGISILDGLGWNAVSLTLVEDMDGKLRGFVGSIGGEQQAGTNNGNRSRIEAVNIFAATMTKAICLVGDEFDPDEPLAPTGDFRATAVKLNAGNGDEIAILTGNFNQNYSRFEWAIHAGVTGNILSADERTINEMLADETLVTIASGSNPGNYWDIAVETGPNGQINRIWFLRGSEVVVMAFPFTDPQMELVYKTGTGSGQIGGYNVNGVDLTFNTLMEADLLHSPKTKLSSIPPVIPEEEEEEEEEEK